MMFSSSTLSILVTALAALDSVVATPVNLESRQSGTFAVTGTKIGGVQPRREVSSLASVDPKGFELFILSWKKLKEMDQKDPLSFYKIATIHGNADNVPWDGVGRGGSTAGPGYCPHGSNVFVTWHRPFLALLEQQINLQGQAIVNSIQDANRKKDYAAALNRMRIPYWDWASGNGQIPDVANVDTHTVTDPVSGQKITIKNPLRQYFFHPQVTFSTSPTNRDNAANQRLAASFGNTRNSIYRILTQGQGQSFNQFSTRGAESSTVGNLETVHDGIHVNVGGGMNPFTTSAFDPLFYLHHANVDRLAALWQAMYPQSWVTPWGSSSGTYSIPNGSTTDAKTPLGPFHSDTRGTLYTSENVRSITQFGYTYPELVGNPKPESIKQLVNWLYAPGRIQGGVHKRSLSGSAPSGEVGHEYILTVTAPAGAGTLGIDFFLAHPNSTVDKTKSLEDPSFVATQGFLGKTTMKGNSHMSAGTISLTSAIHKHIEAGWVDDTSVEGILAYLRANLSLKARRSDGAILTEKDDGVIATVNSVEVLEDNSARDNPNFPVWGKTKEYYSFACGGEVPKPKPEPQACPKVENKIVYVQA